MLRKTLGVDICISFDTTGSMYPCLTQVRRQVVTLARRLFKDVPNLRIAIIAHGDYQDAGTTYVTKTFDFSSDEAAICRFVENVGPTNGYDTPECYETVLHEARALQWRAGTEKALVVIGDDVPHESSYPLNKKKIDWRNELALLLEASIHVYGVHAMPGTRRHSRHFYEEIARVTGGYYLTLDQFAAINDIICAICYKASDPETLVAFREEVRRGKRMDRNMSQVFQTLTGEREEVIGRTGLTPVPAGRFQVLRVDKDIDIKGFVLAQGMAFKKGRGFYQFTKAETIQGYKEVVLRDKVTGDMYSGDEARSMIGLPVGANTRIRPADLEAFDVFVQSTSVNRKLIGGSGFLYEVEDWDRAAA
ncbi:VWA domain-containing protein [bacterium]|nr:VWA domain-containing protein [bacterium]